MSGMVPRGWAGWRRAAGPARRHAPGRRPSRCRRPCTREHAGLDPQGPRAGLPLGRVRRDTDRDDVPGAAARRDAWIGRRTAAVRWRHRAGRAAAGSMPAAGSIRARRQRVPTLEQALALLIELDMEANVEIKPGPGGRSRRPRSPARRWPAAGPRIARRPCCRASRSNSLQAARHARPTCRWAIWSRASLPMARAVQALGCVSLHVSHRRNSDRALRLSLTRACRCSAIPSTTMPRAQRLFELGVACVFSDAPDRISLPAQ